MIWELVSSGSGERGVWEAQQGSSWVVGILTEGENTRGTEEDMLQRKVGGM